MLSSRLRARGYRVTLAHPERNGDFQRDDSPLRALVDQGVFVQVNADSLLGAASGSRTRRLGRHLCTEGLVHALASGGHRPGHWRPVTQLAEGAAAATDLFGPERTHWMAQAAPAAIIEGGELPEAPAIARRQRRRGLFGAR